MDWIKLIVCIFAGIGAGIGTGFAGLSAAAFIAPMLIAFLDFPAYDAVGIALVSDVMASAVSATAYGVQKNINFKRASFMLVFVLLFTVAGSLLGSYVENTTMGTFSMFATIFMGANFIIRPTRGTDPLQKPIRPDKKLVLIQSAAFASMIGMICGFVGAGGGMMMLLVLTSFMGFDLKKAVGTSVFIMTFTALIGAVSHFGIGGIPDTEAMITCIFSTLVSAQLAAVIANKAKPRTLNLVTGIILLLLGIVMLVIHFL